MANVFLFSVRLEQKMQERLEYAATDAGCTAVGTYQSYFPTGVRPAIDAELRDRQGIAVVNFDDDAEAATETVRALRDLGNPEVVCVALGSRQNSDAAIYALRAGCAEYIVSDASHNTMVEQLSHVANGLRPMVSAKGRNGAVVLFVGVRGGCGTTTLASHVALALGRDPDRKTLLVDHAPELGHTALYLQEDPSRYSYADCVRSVDKLDGTMLSGYVRAVSQLEDVQGLDLLLSPDQASARSRDTYLYRDDKEKTGRILQVFRNEYDYVVFDTSLANPELPNLLDLSDTAFLVLTPDIASVRDLRRRLSALDPSPVNEAKMRLIVSREKPKTGVSIKAISEAANIRTISVLPDLYLEICKAINLGFPIPPDVKPFHSEINKILGEIRNVANESQQLKGKPAKKFSFWGGN